MDVVANVGVGDGLLVLAVGAVSTPSSSMVVFVAVGPVSNVLLSSSTWGTLLNVSVKNSAWRRPGNLR